MRKKLKTLCFLLIATCLMTALAATTPVNAEDKALVVAVTKLTITLDPMGSNSNVNERVSNNLIETLIAMNFKTGALEPGLAESWKFVNDKLSVNMAQFALEPSWKNLTKLMSGAITGRFKKKDF